MNGLSLNRIVAIVGIPLFLFATVASTRSAEAPVEIDVVTSLTGPAAFAGQAEDEGFNALEALVNKTGGIGGHPLKFVYEDDQTSPQVAVQLANALIARKVAAFLGPTIVANCRAVKPLIQTSGPVDFCLSPAGVSPPSSYAFDVAPNEHDISVMQIAYLRQRGFKRIAIIATTDASGQGDVQVDEETLKRPENKDMTLVANESFGPGDLGVQAQMARIEAAKPDAIIAWCTGSPFGTVLHGLHDSGLNVPLMMSYANTAAAQMKQFADIMPATVYTAAAGYIIGAAQNATQRRRVDEFEGAMKSLGNQVDILSGSTWDTGLMLVSALRALGSDASSQQIHDYILHQKAFVGIIGVYNMTDGSQRGSSPDDVLMLKWDGAKQLWSQASAFGGKPLP